MLFNSFDFVLFLPIAFAIYWFLTQKNLRLQNLFVLVASYVFYGWWDWRFLALIVFSSGTDYVVGLALHSSRDETRRKLLLICSILVNLGLLGFFKYFGFFIESFTQACSVFGLKPHITSLEIILPVGISFYTFQTLSYTIDIYRREIQPTRDIIAFFAFVSFFPQLVAGPIERARNLLPQFLEERSLDYEQARAGLRHILWGLFKKVVVADTCARSVDHIFANYDTLSGSMLLIGAVYFTFQIYGDFSGYSDIAIGTAKLFGFQLMRNFAFPFFSPTIVEFWQRWHVSLSSWFRDYVYIPLGGSRCGTARRCLNVMATFLLSGLWHGANWTFVCWGGLNGLYSVPFALFGERENRVPERSVERVLSILKRSSGTVATFMMFAVSLVIFRSQNLHEAYRYLRRMFSSSLLAYPEFPREVGNWLWLLLAFQGVEYVQRNSDHPLQWDGLPRVARWVIYQVLAIWILDAFVEPKTFIYFQF